MNKSLPRTLQPGHFAVNRTWLAYRINSVPLIVENREVDLYVLQDAASMFLFGNAFAPAGAACPEVSEAERLLESAHTKRHEWPAELFLPGNPGLDNSFSIIANKHGVSIRNVPESQLSFYIKDTQEGYEEFLGRGESDA